MDLQEFSLRERDRSYLFSEVVAACREILHSSSVAANARTYLDKRLSQFSQDKFDFGYFPEDEHLDILITKVGKETLRKLNLIRPWNVQDRAQTVTYDTGYYKKHNIIMPFKDEYGNIVALVGRTLLTEIEQKDQKIQKYLYTKGCQKALHLFGLSQAKKAILNRDSVIVVEGQIDCITCHAHGFHNTVALGGTSFTKYQLYLLKKKTKNIYLLLDRDDAGVKGEAKIIGRFSKLANIKKITLPSPYKDVDEYLHKSDDYSAFDCVI